MTRHITLRIEDIIYDTVKQYSDKTGLSFNEIFNQFGLQVMHEIAKKYPEAQKNIKLIEHKQELRRYKRKRREYMELRHETDNIFKKIYRSVVNDRFKGLPPNIKMINSFIDEYERLWLTFPDELKDEQQDKHKYLVSLKHPSALAEFLKYKHIEEIGYKNVKARKQLK